MNAFERGEGVVERREQEIHDIGTEAGGSEKAPDDEHDAKYFIHAIGGAGAGIALDPVLPAGYANELVAPFDHGDAPSGEAETNDKTGQGEHSISINKSR